MKKKGARSIPDFSSKKNKPASFDPGAPRVQPPPVVRDQGTKPHATSKKSGQRGS